MNIRAADPADSPALIRLAESTGVFNAREITALQEVLDDYYTMNRADGHLAVVLEEQGQRLGFAYYAPTDMTDRTWHLFWIAVAKDVHGRGLGSELLHHVEADIRRRGGRLLVIETSATPQYQPTHRFYKKHGFTHVGTVPDFYANGDDQALFTKRMGED